MIDTTAALLALRNRALAVVVATTGSTTLAATTTGYSRAAGSFVTDGFRVGMELTPTGFASNTVDVIDAVDASTITTRNTRSAEGATAGRTLGVGLPALRAWENVELSPPNGRPYVEESFVPATNTLLTLPASSGILEETGIYVLKWYGLANTGASSLRASVDALKALFAPGTTLTAGSNTLRIDSNPGPFAGQILPLDDGSAVITLTIPWRAYSLNTLTP